VWLAKDQRHRRWFLLLQRWVKLYLVPTLLVEILPELAERLDNRLVLVWCLSAYRAILSVQLAELAVGLLWELAIRRLDL
jgi:hypothetical protein